MVFSYGTIVLTFGLEEQQLILTLQSKQLAVSYTFSNKTG